MFGSLGASGRTEKGGLAPPLRSTDDFFFVRLNGGMSEPSILGTDGTGIGVDLLLEWIGGDCRFLPAEVVGDDDSDEVAGFAPTPLNPTKASTGEVAATNLALPR